MQLGDASAADAEIGGDVGEWPTLEVAGDDDAALALGEAGQGVRERPPVFGRLGPLVRPGRALVAEGLVAGAFDEIVEPDDERGRAPAFDGGPPDVAGQVVDSPQLVDGRPPDAQARVALEGRPLGRAAVPAQGLEEAGGARGV